MGDATATLTFVMNAVDNVTPAAQTAANSEENLASSANNAQASIDSASISLTKQLVVAHSLRSGISGVTNGLSDLGVISDDVAAGLGKVTAAANVVVGTFQLYRGVTSIIGATSSALGGLLTIETMRSVLQSPWKSAAVGAAVSAGATVAVLAASGAMGGSSNSTTNNTSTTINFNSESSQSERSTASSVLSSIGGTVR